MVDDLIGEIIRVEFGMVLQTSEIVNHKILTSKMGSRYLKVENFSKQEENEIKKKGGHVRNYGRLKKSVIQELATMELDEGDSSKLFGRDRPWRLNRFVRELLNGKKSRYGEVSAHGYTVRVIDGGIASVLGKGTSEGDDDQDADEALIDYAPWDLTDVYWRDFEFWRELLSGPLINTLPDRPFSLFVYAKDSIGDDVPLYYLELEIKGALDRHTVIWELDQVLTTTDEHARPHEASFAASYVSAYQKVYFFLNWDEPAARRIVRAVVSDLPKHGKRNWDVWLNDQHENKWSDAVVSIILIIVSCAISIHYENYAVSLVAGIVVAGIAGEEWMAPQTMLFGAVSRFYANESLSLHMYYRTGISLSLKRVLISLFASVGEVAKLIAASTGLQTVEFLGMELDGGDFVLIIASLVNVICLTQTAYSGVYGSFSHSDFPAKSNYFPKIYVPKRGFMRQIIDDLKPVEEYCSVYRPLLHWQRDVATRFLGNEIDLTSPGAPPSMICYWMSTPASCSMAVQAVYGEAPNLFLLPLAIAEQILALVGAVLVTLLDIPVTLSLFLVLLMKRSHLFSRELIRILNTMALSIYSPCLLLNYIADSYNSGVAAMLELDVLECRARSTARLYRKPLIQKVRTGRSSNHPFKFGDYLYDDCYFRCSDQVIVNPMYSKIGMIDKYKLFFKRHKLLWTTQGGIRYSNPCLSCGDNTVSRKTSIVQGAKKSRVNPLIVNVDDAKTTEEFGFPLPVDIVESRSSFSGYL